MRVNTAALTALRERSGESFDTLAARTSPRLNGEAIRRIERGLTADPRPRTVKAIADALGVPITALMAPAVTDEEAA